MMKIVLLESLGISQELLDSYVKPLKEKGYEFAAYERNDDPAVQIEEAKDADILIIANMPLKAEVINACPKLKYIDVPLQASIMSLSMLPKLKALRSAMRPAIRPLP